MALDRKIKLAVKGVDSTCQIFFVAKSMLLGKVRGGKGSFLFYVFPAARETWDYPKKGNCKELKQQSYASYLDGESQLIQWSLVLSKQAQDHNGRERLTISWLFRPPKKTKKKKTCETLTWKKFLVGAEKAGRRG